MLTKIKEFFKKDIVNKDRQKGLDLLKALSIFCMVLCHLVLFASDEYDSFGYYMADNWLGSYLGVAHAFMLCMGVGMTFTRRNTPKDYVLRGISLFILAYVLNMFRAGLYCLIFKADLATSFYYITMNDILQFAGLANIAVGILKKFKVSNLYILMLGALMSFAVTTLPSIDFGNLYANVVVGLFVPTYDPAALGYAVTTSTFSFANWFVFVGAGLVLGDIIQRLENPDKFYKKCAIIGGSIGAAYLITISITGPTCGIYYFNACTLLPEDLGIAAEAAYYGVGIVDVVGLIAVDLGLAGAFHFLSKKFNFKFLTMTAKNITVVYFLHWILIGFVNMFLINALEIPFSMLGLYIAEVIIYFASAFLSIPVSKLFKKLKTLIK